MGVKYLWSIIKKTGTADTPRNKRLAIDTSIWLHFYKNVPLDIFIYNTIKRILKLLYNKNKPIFVFDTSTPYQKKKTIEDRKTREVVTLAKKYVQNVICKICNIPYRECEHANVENQDTIEEGNKMVITRIKEKRDKKWGITYDDEMKILDGEEFEKMSKLQKLKALVNLRKKRKLPASRNVGDGLEFSISQINNVRKRNRVNDLIDKLEERNERRIMSDCSKSFTFQEPDDNRENLSEEVDILHIFDSDMAIEVNNESDEYKKDLSERDTIGEEIFLSSSISEEYVEESYDYDLLEIKDNTIDEEETFEITQSTSQTKEQNEVLRETTTGEIATTKDFENINIERYNTIIKDVADVTNLIEKIPIDHDRKKIDNKDLEISRTNKDRIEPFLSNLTAVNNANTEEVRHISITENDMADDIRSLTTTIKQIFEAFDINYLDAPMEADAQCAYLNYEGLVDGIITEDNDMFLYGGRIVYKNYFKKNCNIINYDMKKTADFLTRDI